MLRLLEPSWPSLAGGPGTELSSCGGEPVLRAEGPLAVGPTGGGFSARVPPGACPAWSHRMQGASAMASKGLASQATDTSAQVTRG